MPEALPIADPIPTQTSLCSRFSTWTWQVLIIWQNCYQTLVSVQV